MLTFDWTLLQDDEIAAGVGSGQVMNDDEGGDDGNCGEGKGRRKPDGENRDIDSDQKAELDNMAESHAVESIISQVRLL